ncbi:BTAD domain-containing putative transcriptional regulator [Spirillospora sp. NPDC050679]
MLDIRLLGPVEVVGAVGPVGGMSRMPRLLLAVLALCEGDRISAAELVDELWGDEPPEQAESALHAHITRLRRALDGWEPDGPGRARLRHRSGGYVLDLGPEETDVMRFKRLRAEGFVRADASAVAVPLLESALRLWRGPALADVVGGPRCARAADELTEMRLATATELIEHRFKAGAHNVAVIELWSLVEAHPLDEALTDQLMVALHGSGRRSQALAAYHRLRRRLLDAFGVEPTAALQWRMHTILDAQTPVPAPRAFGMPEPGPAPADGAR